MVGYNQEDSVKYDNITSITPVGKITKITNTNPAKIYFGDDFGKFAKGDRVYITRQKKSQGYELFDLQTYILDNPNDKDGNYFLKTLDNKQIDASGLLDIITGGFAQVVNEPTAPEAPEIEANKFDLAGNPVPETDDRPIPRGGNKGTEKPSSTKGAVDRG
jgi:hypothetical protein